jgi:hypothetical protein
MLFVVTQQESSALAADELHPVGADAVNAIAVGRGGC